MAFPDFNLLVTLDVLLSEGSVARAAYRLRLSPSATSRALARLREALGDPLLVRAGQRLVPTPRALELRERVARLVAEGIDLLRPQSGFDPKTLSRIFRIRSSDGFVENFGPALLSRLSAAAPGVRLHFLQKADKDSSMLREGLIDLETGVIEDTTSPELIARPLFVDGFVAVVRKGHRLDKAELTLMDYLEHGHIAVSRRGSEHTLIDDALAPIGAQRRVEVVVGGFAAALTLAGGCDLVATVPDLHTKNLRAGLRTLPLPFPSPALTVSLLWHPRSDADPAHAWMRATVREVCRVLE